MRSSMGYAQRLVPGFGPANRRGSMRVSTHMNDRLIRFMGATARGRTLLSALAALAAVALAACSNGGGGGAPGY